MIFEFFLPPHNLEASLFIGFLSLFIGSFLNVVIYRLPIIMRREFDNYIAQENNLPSPHTTRYNLAIPRSSCPHCQHQIRALENIPILSYVFLKGKCRACHAPISMRYPIVEILTGIISGFLVWHFGSGFMGLSTLLLAYLLICMTFIDADTKLLPDNLTLLLLWCGLLVNLNATFTPLSEAVLGAVIGYLALWSIYWIFKLTTGKEGMGYGDFKLLAALGAWLGWHALPIIIFLSSFVGALTGIIFILVTKKERNHQIPFGPYLAFAGLMTLLCGDSIMMFIQSTY